MYFATCGQEISIFEHPDYKLVHRRGYNDKKCLNLQWNCDSNVIAVIVQKDPKFGYLVEENKKFIELNVLKRHEIQHSISWCNLKDSINAISFAKNNPRLLAASNYVQNQVCLYDIKSQVVLKNFQKYKSQNPFNVLDFSDKDSYLAGGCFNDGIVELFTINRNTKSSTLSMSKLQTVQTLNFSTLHKNDLAAGGYEGDFIVWDITTGRRKVVNSSCHTAPISVFKFSTKEHHQAFSVGLDCDFKLYDLSSTGNPCQMTKTFDIPLNGMSITPDGDNIAISSINGDIFIIDLRRSKSILKQFQANSNLCGKREIYHIGYLNGDQKKPFEIDIVDYLEETGSFDVSSTGGFDFNQSASVLSSAIDSHDSADFLLWDKFAKIDMSAQSSPVIPITAQQSPLTSRTSSILSQQNTQTPLVLTPTTTLIPDICVSDENKENIESSNLQKKDPLIKKEPETEPEVHNSFVIGSSVIDGNSSVCMVDKSVQVSIEGEIYKDKGSDSMQPPRTTTATATTSNSADSDLSEIRHPFSNILNNPVFIMEYLMDYAEFKMKEEERFNIVMNEISRLSDRVSKLDDRIKDFIEEF